MVKYNHKLETVSVNILDDDVFVFRPNGIAAVYRNDLRQVHVNNVAEHYGSGTGTARWNGVPGTGRHFGYGYHHGYGY